MILIYQHASFTLCFPAFPASSSTRPLCLSSHYYQSLSVALFGFICPDNPLLGRKSRLKSFPPAQPGVPFPQPAPRNASLTFCRAWTPVSGVTKGTTAGTCWLLLYLCAELIAQELHSLPALRLLPGCSKPVVCWNCWSHQCQGAPRGLEECQALSGLRGADSRELTDEVWLE